MRPIGRALLGAIPVFLAAAWAPAQVYSSAEDLAADNERLRAELEQCRTAMRDLQAQTDAARKAMEAERQAMAEQLRAMRKEFEAARRQETASTEERGRGVPVELEQAREQLRAAVTQANRMAEELSRVTATLDSLRRQNHQQAEAIAALRRQVEALGGRPAAGDATTRPADKPVPTDQKIQTTVTAIRDDAASLGVGSNAGLKLGMKLVVYRGSQFIARIRIDAVEPDRATGTVTDKRGDVLVGDAVVLPAW